MESNQSKNELTYSEWGRLPKKDVSDCVLSVLPCCLWFGCATQNGGEASDKGYHETYQIGIVVCFLSWWDIVQLSDISRKHF